jgi:hypothetical protein
MDNSMLIPKIVNLCLSVLKTPEIYLYKKQNATTVDH